MSWSGVHSEMTEVVSSNSCAVCELLDTVIVTLDTLQAKKEGVM